MGKISDTVIGKNLHKTWKKQHKPERKNLVRTQQQQRKKHALNVPKLHKAIGMGKDMEWPGTISRCLPIGSFREHSSVCIFLPPQLSVPHSFLEHHSHMHSFSEKHLDAHIFFSIALKQVFFIEVRCVYACCFLYSTWVLAQFL